MKVLFFSFFGMFLLLGCQSSLKNELADIKPGLYKEDVLDRVGSPHRRERWQGQDRWTYMYFENSEKNQKEILFSEGKATYVGDHQNSKISAEQQDQINEAQNVELEKKWAAQREESRKDLLKYESDIKGSDEIRYVPKFVPVE